MNGDVVHRLGAVVGVVSALVWLVRWGDRTRQARRTRRRLAGALAPRPTAAAPRLPVPSAARNWLPHACVACAGWALVGGLTGVVVGLIAAAGLWRWRAAEDPRRRERERLAAGVTRQLPLAADLLSACIAAGAGPVTAAQAVGDALGGPVGEALARGAAEVRLGGEPGAAWQRLASVPGTVALARLLERADASGLPLSVPVARLAAEARAEWARAATARARRAAVMVSAPVGLCFLPAFVAVGVLPVVIGLAGGVLGGGGGA
ncbi:type II secretion system F family protein [Streptomyces griseomycini]|uniref:Pilus assembly protein TadC n=1 Tax=Streptomyces griseomycini TaxID=66895 RepID=A0A7W7LYV9_9ACTN|nr:type II secretion system F family protein [Streptomyces griseomycini]MBB4898246.1 pilus assembly protein TadC [Streptomyces griseomycini]GGR45535.1 membrane protein [Streptomyces griseomycini]